MKVPGIELDFGGEKRVFAPINAAAFKQYREEIGSVFNGGPIPDLELVAKLALASLQRNYAEITLAQVEEALDFGNLIEVFEAVVNVSGLVASAGNMQRRLAKNLQAPS
ncbi:MAG: hypothetical protein AB3X44_16305 [Leptothrix sp. (in: b-proteobacteria)]